MWHPWHTPTAPLWLISGALALLAYYLFAWWRVGRGPPPGDIRPRGEPPAGLGPAAAGWLHDEARLRGVDTRRAFVAALVSLGVKGCVRIERRDGVIRIHRLNARCAGLTPAERTVLDRLPNATFGLSEIDVSFLRAMQQELGSVLEREVAGKYIEYNRRWFRFGLGMTAVVAGGLALLAFSGDPLAPFILTGGMLMLIFLLPILALIFLLLRFLRAEGWKERLSVLPVLVFVGGLLAYGLPALVLWPMMKHFPSGEDMRKWYMAGLAAWSALFVLPMLFRYLLPRPTWAGRKALDDIEGLRLFLRQAERDLADGELADKALADGGGDGRMSVSRFKKLLPYAISLEQERPWTRAFRAWLANAATSARWSPLWYERAPDDGPVRTRGEDLVPEIGAELDAALPGRAADWTGG